MKGGIIERSNVTVKEMRPKSKPIPPQTHVQAPRASNISGNANTAQMQASYRSIEHDAAAEDSTPSENDLILNNMTPDEFQESYAEITSLLSAKNIAFLRSKSLIGLEDDINQSGQQTALSDPQATAQAVDQVHLQSNNLNEFELFDMSGMRLWHLEDAISCIRKPFPQDNSIPVHTWTEIVQSLAPTGLYKVVRDNDELDANSAFTMHRLLEMSRSQMKMQAISALGSLEGFLYRRDICCSLISYADCLPRLLSAQHFLRHDQYHLFATIANTYNQVLSTLLMYFDNDHNQTSKFFSQALLSLCSQDIPADLASLMLLQWRRGIAMRDINLLTTRLECLCEYLSSTIESAVENMLSSSSHSLAELPQAYFIVPHAPRPEMSYEEWHINRLEHLQFIFQSKDDDNEAVEEGPRSLQDLALALPERDKFILRSRWSRLDVIYENEDILWILSQVITQALSTEEESTSTTWQRPAMAAMKIVKLLITQTLFDKEKNLRFVQFVLQPMFECLIKLLPALISSRGKGMVVTAALDAIILALKRSKRFSMLRTIISKQDNVQALVNRFQQQLDAEQAFMNIDKQILDMLSFVDLNAAMQMNLVSICCAKMQKMIARKESLGGCCELIQALTTCVAMNQTSSSTSSIVQVQDRLHEITQQVMSMLDDYDKSFEQEAMMLQLCIATNSTIPAAYDPLSTLVADSSSSSTAELLQRHCLQYLQLLYLSKQPPTRIASDRSVLSKLQLMFDQITASLNPITVIDGLIKRKISQYQQLSLVTIHAILSMQCLSDTESIAMALLIVHKLQGSMGVVAQSFLSRTIMTMYQACFSDQMITNEMQDHVMIVIEAVVTSQKMNAWVMSKMEESGEIVFPLHPLWMIRALLGLTQPVFGSWMILVSQLTLTTDVIASQQQLPKQLRYEQLYLLMKLMRMENSLSWSLDDSSENSSNAKNTLQKEVVLSYALLLSNAVNTILDNNNGDFNQAECEEAMTKLFCSENTLTLSTTEEQNKQTKQLKKRQHEGMLSFCQNLLDCSLNQIEAMELQTVEIMILTIPTIMPTPFRRKAWEELGLLKLLHLADDKDVMQVMIPIWIKSLRKQINCNDSSSRMTAREYAMQEEIWRCLQTLRVGSLQQCYVIVNLAMISLSSFVLHELLVDKPQLEEKDIDNRITTIIRNPYATALLLNAILAQDEQKNSFLQSLFTYWLTKVATTLTGVDSNNLWASLAADCLLEVNQQLRVDSIELIILQRIRVNLSKDDPSLGLRAGSEVSLAMILNLS